jgi:hypothetical protein
VKVVEDMDRRQLLKYLISSAVVVGSGMNSVEAWAGRLRIRGSSQPATEAAPPIGSLQDSGPDGDYLDKMEKFYEPHSDDISLVGEQLSLLEGCWLKLKKVSDLIGFGNFNIIGFDDFRKTCQNYASVGTLTAAELAFLEELYYRDAGVYGFFGARVFKEITDEIPGKDIVQLENGQYLYQGHAFDLYQKLRSHIGNSLMMTSGIRSVTKQLYLFIDKAIRSRGNLSLSSRAIAPPGYSFHGIGDFDIGRYGWGARNFTKEFESTFEFKELYRLGYVKLRYPHGNLLGVRYEPWHVKTKPVV